MSDNHPPPRFIDPVDVVVAGHRGDDELLDAALIDQDPAVRRLALGALLRRGRLDLDQLRTALRDPDDEVVRRALELTARHQDGDELVPEVTELLAGAPITAELACFVLGELEVAEPSVVGALEQHALEHEDALVREAAVASLGALHAGRATILEALGDKATVRRRAVIALAPFEGPDIDAALAAALKDRDWQVRQAAEDLLAPYADDEDED